MTDQYAFHIVAQEVRRERTGLHAQLSLLMNTTILAFDTFNVGRQEERTRLANSAHSHFRNGLEETYPKDHLKHDLDEFCLALPEMWEIGRYQLEHYDADADVPPLKHVLYPFVVEDGGTIVFAPPGSGKSYTVMAMAASVAAGIRTIWDVPERRPVLYVNLERAGDSMRRRFRVIAKALGIKGTDHDLHFLHARGQSFKALSKRISRWRQEHPNGVGAMDSISRAGYGSLKDDDTANSIVDFLNGHFGTWIAIGHTTRQTADHTFGSIHFDAGEDVGVKLSSEAKPDGTLGLSLEIVKANDMGAKPTYYLALEFDGDDLKSIRRARVTEFPKLVQLKRETDVDRLERYILDAGPCTIADAATGAGVARADALMLMTGTDRFRIYRKEAGKTLYCVAADAALPF